MVQLKNARKLSTITYYMGGPLYPLSCDYYFTEKEVSQEEGLDKGGLRRRIQPFTTNRAQNFR